jgi:hypothetical protein
MGYGWGSSELILSSLFIYLYLKKESVLVQLINYQLFDLLLSLELKSHMLKTNSRFTLKLLICAIGDLTVCNLAYLTASDSLWSVQNFFYLFFFLGSWFACVRPLPFILCYILNISCFQRLSGIN